MRKLIPLILLLFGLGGGAAAGFLLRPEPVREPAGADMTDGSPCGDPGRDVPPGGTAEEEQSDKDYVKLSNQFVVPVMASGRVASLVVMSLSVEVAADARETVYTREPKLRDSFLQVLFDHANMGGFDDDFTNSATMDILRQALLETGRKILGPVLTDVLITDIARQDY